MSALLEERSELMVDDYERICCARGAILAALLGAAIHEAGMIRSTTQTILTRDTDWRFIAEAAQGLTGASDSESSVTRLGILEDVVAGAEEAVESNGARQSTQAIVGLPWKPAYGEEM